MSGHLVVCGLGKAYRSYRSEWLRVASWFGLQARPSTEQWVVRGVNFAVGPGESVGILGRNGAGKSTLLKMITGTLQPSEGTVSVQGRIHAILELGMGFNPELTGRQNVLHVCGLQGHSRTNIEAEMPGIEAFADVGGYFDQPLRVYSSGMQMRVAFAAATAFRPDILIVDEALSVGDAYFQAKCYERITAMRQAGTTLLYVSHAVGDVVKHCERALFIKEGRLAMDGSSREVSNAYLDYVFGRNTEAGETKPAEAPTPAASFRMDGVDRFHTRPGYRKDEYRWGNRAAKIADFSIATRGGLFPPAVDTGDRMKLSVRVDFERPVARPVFGLLIKTLEGIHLYGTNSMLADARYEPAPAAPGDAQVVRFTFDVPLNSGSYLLSVGVSDQADDGELVPLDRRYDSILLNVRNARNVPGLMDVNASLDVTVDADCESAAV